jgi:hypothetical protein
MKKILVVLSLVCFVAVTVSNAQTTTASTKQETKTEAASVKAAETATVKSDDSKKEAGCCVKPNKACCKSSTASKVCTPEQKAACAKMGEKEAEAKVEKPAEEIKGSN